MSGITVIPRTVRHIAIATGRPYEQFRAEYEAVVPPFDRLEAIGAVNSGVGWVGIENLSRNTAINGLVSFFTFDPSPVMKLNGAVRRGVTYLSGNIIDAEKGFRVDPGSFLYLPLRVVISEAADGTAVLGVDLPADLFEVFPGPELAAVAAQFTRTLVRVLQQLGLPVPCEIADPTATSSRCE
ncbi:MAG TPA: hypothetical protein VF070_00835 [Streptosporangiaceae bacterium]